MSDWKEYILGEISHVQTGPFGSQLHMKDYVSVGTPIITVEHLGENRIIHENLPLVSDADKKRLNKYTLLKGDIVFSRVGSVDRRALVSERENGWLFSGRCLRVRVKSQFVEPRYLSYYFGQEAFKEHIRNIAVGATMPSINTAILSSIKILVPNIKDQYHISEVLGSLDEKIDLLNRQNQTLGQIAELLYRQWFVVGETENWIASTIGEYITTKGGGTPSTSESSYWNGDVCWTSPKDLSGTNSIFMFDTNKKITQEGLKKISSGLLPIRTVLLSSRAPIGYLAITEVPLAINQGYIACIPDRGVSSWFIIEWLKTNMDKISNAANGSTFLEISKTTFRQLPFAVPPRDLLNKFDTAVEPIYEKIRTNEVQIRDLTQTRNILLPKLMSGEIKVGSNNIRFEFA